MKATYEDLERKIAVLDLQLNLSLAAERAWETTMMLACGEDGPKSVADKFAELQAKCAELAAENGGLKKAVEFATAPDMWIEQADGMLDYRYCEWYVDVLKAAMETPATDAFLAEVRAQGVDALNIQFKKCSGMLYADSVIETAAEFAAQLRQGAAL